MLYLKWGLIRAFISKSFCYRHVEMKTDLLLLSDYFHVRVSACCMPFSLDANVTKYDNLQVKTF